MTARIIVLCAIVGIVAIVAYRSCGHSNRLDVDPHAREEIERAKHR